MASPKQKTRRPIAPASREAQANGVDLGTDKLYFKIGEVADIVGVAAHVLRYWESEFPTIKPHKSRSQQRVYRRKDVETLLKIKHLLYDRKFTIAGARQELRKGSDKVDSAPVEPRYRAHQSLLRVREQLEQLSIAVRSDDRASIAADPAAFIRNRPARAGVDTATGDRSRGRSTDPRPADASQPLLERPARTERLDMD